MPVTFHRAFDTCLDLTQALEDIVRSGASRILTAAAASTAPEAAAKIKALAATAGQRITIVPGAGINAGNILQLAAATGAREFHSGLSSVLSHHQTDYAKFENEVRAMVDALPTISPE